MSRWIDADALIEQTDDRYSLGEIGRRERDDIVDALEFAPSSIDIVRCQDCKHWVYNFNGCKRNPCTEPWLATDFCNYGEVRNEQMD